MMDIYDYAKYPKEEDWEKICEGKIDTIEKIQLEMNKRKFNILDFDEGYYGMNLHYWLQEFNNRSFDLITNYVIMKSYYDEGIPDEEWFKSPGENGTIVQYFPHFDEKHHAFLYWFSFYLDSYYTRFSGLIDCVYHLINTKYQFDIEPKLGFKNEVLKKLKSKDRELYDYLITLPNDGVYKKINEYRNNLVHNFRPNQIDAGYKKEVNSDGKTVMSMSIGNYTPSHEFMNNINDSLDLLANITETIRDKVSQ